MRQLRREYDKKNKIPEEENEDENDQTNYLPMSFDTMISYLSFCTSREELKQSIDVPAMKYLITQDNSLTALERFKKFQEMFSLTNQYSKIKNQEMEQSLTIKSPVKSNDLVDEKRFTETSSK